MRNSLFVLLSSLFLLCFAACSNRPADVLSKEQMAQLMADIHIGESVAEYQNSVYNNDSLRQNLKISIYQAHGVTSEQVDSSFAWYGRHMKDYIDICDRTIEILEKRQEEMGSLIAADAALSLPGDSVDIWTGARHVEITPLLPTRALRVKVQADSMIHPGDNFTWRIKLVGAEPNTSIRWNALARYTDGAIETYAYTTSTQGWNEMKFFTDSTRTLSTFIASAALEGSATVFHLDSISLVRHRLSPAFYQFRSRQHFYPNPY